MPNIGDIVKAKELGKKHTTRKYIWATCQVCNKPRWVVFFRGQPRSPKCLSCQAKTMHRSGEEASNWQGGRTKTTYGYIQICVSRDDFFYPMAKRNNYILEHRLVMAKYLNRCLLPWEIVHHKNGIRDDNRIENLQLLGTQGKHNTAIQREIKLAYERGLRNGNKDWIEWFEQYGNCKASLADFLNSPAWQARKKEVEK